jgi:adenylate cyclase
MNTFCSLIYSRFGFLLSFLLLSLSLSPLFAVDKVALYQNEWQVMPGWPKKAIRKYIKSSGKLETRKTRKFPLVADKIFPVPELPQSAVKGDLIYYTLQTKIKLSRVIQLPELLFSVIGDNWNIFLNGRLIHSENHIREINGKHTITKHRTVRQLRLDIPPGILKKGKNLLTIQVVGERAAFSFLHNDTIGFYRNKGYYLQSKESFVLKDEIVYSIMLISVYFFFGLYHIILFLARRSLLHNLYFGLFSIVLSMYFMFSKDFIFLIWNDFDTIYNTRAEYALLYLVFPTIALFYHYFLGRILQKFLIQFIIAINGVFFLSALVLPLPLSRAFLLFWQLSALVQFVIIIYLLVRAVVRNKTDSWKVSIVSILMLAMGTSDIVNSMFLFTDIRLLDTGFLVFIFFLTGLVAIRQKRDELQVVHLNDSLLELNQSMQRFVPSKVIEELEKSSAKDLRSGDSVLRIMSVMFSDIRGFTSLSEKMSADTVFQFLNNYLSRISPIFEKHHGFIDKFMGDGIMGLFPQDLELGNQRTTSDNALFATLDMFGALEKYNEDRAKSGYEALEIGIGLHTGPLMLGALGGDDRLSTTVIGNTVNTCSRLEGLTKYFGTGCILSEDLYLEVTDHDKFNFREIGSIRVKGKTSSSTVYELLDMLPPQKYDQVMATLQKYHEAVNYYRMGKFADSLAILKELEKKSPDDVLFQRYIDRNQDAILKYGDKTIPSEWTGVLAFY